MPEDHYKGFLGFFREWLFWKREYPLFEENDKEPVPRGREPDADELALGWAEMRDEDDAPSFPQLVAVPQEHRATHFYVVGSSGSGKTRFLETLILQDAKNGYGFGVVDANSDLTEDLKGHLYLAKKDDMDFLRERVILIDPSDDHNTVCFNPLERVDGMDTDAVAGELVEVFKKLFGSSWGYRLEDLLRNTLIALIENDMTLAELPLFLTDFNFRDLVLAKVEDTFCLQYFDNFNSHPPKVQREWSESTLNKVRGFLSYNKVRQMFTSPKSTFSFRDAMDNQKILLVKLDRGKLKGSADLLGSLLLAKIQMTAFARSDTLQAERLPFYLYVDEFQDFATDNFIQTLAQSRKYMLPLILAHQQLAQLPPALRASILTNCKLQAYFQISRADADTLAKESFASIYQNPPGWEWYVHQLQELKPMECVVKNKVVSGVVRIQTSELLLPHEIAGVGAAAFASSVAEAQIGSAYLRPRAEVEAEYKSRSEAFSKAAEEQMYKERKRS